MAKKQSVKKTTINSIIVEDEKSGRDTLLTLLQQNCPHVAILGEAASVSEAVGLIDTLKPNLVFLDINLPDGAGFNIFNQVSHKSFEVIFTTAYNEFAVKAFEFSALHYLLKPFSGKELIEAVNRYKHTGGNNYFNQKIETLGHNLSNNKDNNGNIQLMLPINDGYEIIDSKEIAYFEADQGYSVCNLSTNGSVLISKTLSNLEKILNKSHFVRIHRKHIVNINYVKRYKFGRDGYVVLKNKVRLKISRNHMESFQDEIKGFASFL